MPYQDHIRNSVDDKPTCWGHPNTYDQNDFECQGCRWQHSCRAAVGREGRPVVINTSRPTYRSGMSNNNRNRCDDGGMSASYESGVVSEGERPIERFAKDCASGALRGLFYEAWQFFRNFRFS